MQQPQIAPYPVSDFLQWEELDQLLLTPKFQRRDVWAPKAKSYLVDSIIRLMPIPPLFLRLRIDPSKRLVIREVVDGQQRLRAVLGFISGDFPILGVHNREFAGCRFNELPSNVQADMLAYKFQVNTLESISDAEVLRIFARLNTYTTPLVGQELINAEFFGAFKQTVYDIAFEHYTFWTTNNVITDRKIARMADAELTSEIVICMLDGIRQTKAADLRSFYEKYDDAFPLADKCRTQFTEIIDIIGDVFREQLRTSPFHRTPLFYSLFLAIYDLRYGLPKSRQRRRGRTGIQKGLLRDRLERLTDDLHKKGPPVRVARFLEDSAKATADASRRLRRHNFLMKALFG